jgi:hypothetical protein
MTLRQRLSLLWRRFSPLEEQLLAAVRDVLPPPARVTFDAQVAGITRAQRNFNEICFYRVRRRKVDWSDVPSFPRTGEFGLAEVRFSVGGQKYKARLTSIKGHIFDFTIRPGPKAITFSVWDSGASARLLADPLINDAANEPQAMPDSWREFLRGPLSSIADGWIVHDGESVYRTTIGDAEFLVLAEREGDEFILHRIEPAGTTLFYLGSHDGRPGPIGGDFLDVLQRSDKQRT